MTIDYVEAFARVLERHRVAPGACWVANQLGRRQGYPEPVVLMAKLRLCRILDRIAGRSSSPLDDAKIDPVIERCFASVNEKLVSFLQKIDPTLEAGIARRILDLPDHKLVRPSVSGPSSAARTPTSSDRPSPPAAAAFGPVRAGGVAPRTCFCKAKKIVPAGRAGLR